MANIVLDGVTYTGRGLANQIATWVNAASGILAAFGRVTASVFLPTRKGEKAKVQWHIRIPVVTDEPSSCACPGDVVDEIDCYITVRATQGVSATVREDMADQIKDLTALADFKASIVSFDQPNG